MGACALSVAFPESVSSGQRQLTQNLHHRFLWQYLHNMSNREPQMDKELKKQLEVSRHEFKTHRLS